MPVKKGTRFPWHKIVCPNCGGPMAFWSCLLCHPEERGTFHVDVIQLDLSLIPMHTGRLSHKGYRRGYGELARVEAIRSARGRPESRERTRQINLARQPMSAEARAKCAAAAKMRWDRVRQARNSEQLQALVE